MPNKSKVIIITGPCGVGKTTITKLLGKQLKIAVEDGDKIKQTLFPTIDYITQYPEKLKMVKAAIFELSKDYFARNASVIIDYVIIGEDYIKQYQSAFKENLVFKVLLPKKEVIHQRDLERACWTSGKELIDELHQKYLNLVQIIGKENYLDNEKETPEETVQKIIQLIQNKQ